MRRRLLQGTASAVVLLVAAAVAGGLVRWPVADDGLRAGVLGAIERGSGLTVTAAGAITVRLLPRPTIEVADLAIRGGDGAVALDAESMRGWLVLASLWGGPLRLAGVSFVIPTVALDLDRLDPILEAPGRLAGLLHTPGVKLAGGVVRLVSSDRHRDMMLTDVTGTFAWPSGGSEASLAGTAVLRGVAVEVQADVDGPDRLLDGGQALASLHLKSATLNLDATGTLFGAGEVRAAGRLGATTPDLPAFLRKIGTPAPQVGGIGEARLSGGATVTDGAVSIDNATLNLDDMVFDGALAVRRRGEHASLAGTLATDSLDLDRFLQPLPSPVDAGGRWSEQAIETRAIAFDDIDLRVSASTAALGPFRIEDGSLSLQSGDGRLELSLGEARAYGGLLKGRVVAALDGRDTVVRAEATLSRLDLGALLGDAPGHFDSAGTMSGHLSLDSRGTTPAALIRALAGRGDVSVRSGRIGSRLAGTLVHVMPGPQLATTLFDSATTAFETATIAASAEGGVARLGNGAITWPSSLATLSGTVSLADQSLDLDATVNAPEAPAAESRYVLKGPWRQLRLKPARPPS